MKLLALLNDLAESAGITVEPRSPVLSGRELLAAGTRGGDRFLLAAAPARRSLTAFADGEIFRSRDGYLMAVPVTAENTAGLRLLLPWLAPSLMWDDPAVEPVVLGNDPEAAWQTLSGITWQRFAAHDTTPFTTEFAPGNAAAAARSGACRFRMDLPAGHDRRSAPAWVAECAGQVLLCGGVAIRVSADAAAAAGQRFGNWAEQLAGFAASLPQHGREMALILDPVLADLPSVAEYACLIRELRRHPAMRCALALPAEMPSADREMLAAFAAPLRLVSARGPR